MSLVERCCGGAVALLAALALPSTAFAHVGKGTPVATSFPARIEAMRPPSGAVEAKVVDGDRGLWLRVSPHSTVVIPGAAGEPLLRFDRDGVFVNVRSLTAQSDRIDRFDLRPDFERQARPRWHRLTAGHSYLWHEHRLHALEPLARGRHRTAVLGRWSVPLVIDGRRHSLTGVLVYRAAPSGWPWLALGCALLLSALLGLAVSRGVARRLAVAEALLATLLVWTVRIGRELYGRPGLGVGNYLGVAFSSLVGAALLAGLLQRDDDVRVFAAFLVGAGCVYETWTMLPVLSHAIALTDLPTRFAQVAVAAIAGLGAGVVAITLRELSDRASQEAPA